MAERAREVSCVYVSCLIPRSLSRLDHASRAADTSRYVYILLTEGLREGRRGRIFGAAWVTVSLEIPREEPWQTPAKSTCFLRHVHSPRRTRRRTVPARTAAVHGRLRIISSGRFRRGRRAAAAPRPATPPPPRPVARGSASAGFFATASTRPASATSTTGSRRTTAAATRPASGRAAIDAIDAIYIYIIYTYRPGGPGRRPTSRYAARESLVRTTSPGDC